MQNVQSLTALFSAMQNVQSLTGLFSAMQNVQSMALKSAVSDFRDHLVSPSDLMLPSTTSTHIEVILEVHTWAREYFEDDLKYLPHPETLIYEEVMPSGLAHLVGSKDQSSRDSWCDSKPDPFHYDSPQSKREISAASSRFMVTPEGSLEGNTPLPEEIDIDPSWNVSTPTVTGTGRERPQQRPQALVLFANIPGAPRVVTESEERRAVRLTIPSANVTSLSDFQGSDPSALRFTSTAHCASLGARMAIPNPAGSDQTGLPKYPGVPAVAAQGLPPFADFDFGGCPRTSTSTLPERVDRHNHRPYYHSGTQLVINSITDAYVSEGQANPSHQGMGPMGGFPPGPGFPPHGFPPPGYPPYGGPSFFQQTQLGGQPFFQYNQVGAWGNSGAPGTQPRGEPTATQSTYGAPSPSAR
ncbi:hypothetical protein BDV95DRAFT_603408 [Massariosphaeria phaeospora]|uniref:Uncharacterized protein n=1 Tax=Massariosphaeria phaeospora TaxID=100035 RepID=A0A7C8ICB8_9PLEO|nr:hypothetical protein BDV95DRAFT_603408 [Massariosphaeria phaeospora]